MKNFSLVLFFLFCVSPCQAQQNQLQCVFLTVVECDTTEKALVCGDGISPFYWRFGIPDSRWEEVRKEFCDSSTDILVEIEYTGLPLSDQRAIRMANTRTIIGEVRSLVAYKPKKLF